LYARLVCLECFFELRLFAFLYFCFFLLLCTQLYLCYIFKS